MRRKDYGSKVGLHSTEIGDDMITTVHNLQMYVQIMRRIRFSFADTELKKRPQKYRNDYLTIGDSV